MMGRVENITQNRTEKVCSSLVMLIKSRIIIWVRHKTRIRTLSVYRSVLEHYMRSSENKDPRIRNLGIGSR
jgi:hypothetical protein